MISKKEIRTAFIYSLPVMVGYIFLGIAFGLILRTGGYPLWYPVLMSLVIYSGALEFAVIPLLAQPFNPLSVFIMGLMISARHLFYGIPMLEKYRNAGFRKIPLAFGLTDETFSVLSTVDIPEDLNAQNVSLVLTLLNYFYWNLGSFLGAAAGEIIRYDLKGLDFALTALFIVLLIEQMKNRQGIISGILGFAVSAVALILFGSGNMVIVSMIAVLVLLLSGRRLIEA